MNKFYLTTAIPYVNAKPHVGHALEFVQADVIKRFHKILGDQTLLLSGADENAIKNVQAAEKAGVPVQKFIDGNSKLFEDIAKKLNVGFDVFQRGSSTSHHKASQELWKLCAHDIYKKTYTGLYCVGCELFYEKSELNEKGECFEHPGKPLEEVSEENYFFKLSKYEKQIKELVEKDKLKIYPEFRKNEVLGFLKEGLKDISVSRSNKRTKNWGVEVPNDSEQRMYVWFDALNIYQSGVGFGNDEKEYQKWWPADLHVIGKGIIRFHAVYWPAFLLSANLPLPKALFVHGYLTIDGQKMSKSLGNVADPLEFIEKYGVDALRYYLLKEISPFADGDFAEKKLVDLYNSDLANGLGNLVSRVAKLCENSGFTFKNRQKYEEISPKVKQALNEFKFDEALKEIWFHIKVANETINETEPWKKTGEELKKSLTSIISFVEIIIPDLKPLLPETAEKIETQFEGPKIKSSSPLFPRINV
jgi:methionyl-tRNA synthetase